MQRSLSFGGDSPQARFGHTITPIGKERERYFLEELLAIQVKLQINM
jgi:hypothetical protein